MWIQRAVFKNFGPHAHLDLKLGHGLIGIIGRNGCGKSTITDGLYAALTNDFGRFDGVKTDCIRSMSGEKDESSIYLEIEHEGSIFKLLRGIRPSRNELVIDNEKPVTKANDIQALLHRRLGIDPRLMDKYVFVKQWDMFSFLSDTPGDRARTYQHLCGTVKAQAIVDEIEAVLKNDAALRIDMTDNSDELVRRIAELKSEAAKAAGEVVQARGKTLSDDRHEQLTETVSKWKLLSQLNDYLSEARLRLERAAQVESDYALALSRQKGLADDLRKLVSDLKPSAEQGKAILAKIDAFHKRVQKRSYLANEQSDLEEDARQHPRPEFMDEASQLDTLKNSAAELTANIARATKTLEVFNRDGVVECPTCGTPVSEMDEHLESLQAQVDVDTAERARIKELITAEEARVRIRRQWETWKVQHDAKVKANARAIADLKETEELPGYDEDDLQQVIADYDEQVGNLNAADRLANETALKHSRASAQLDEIGASIRTQEARVSENQVTESEFKAAELLLAEHVVATRNVAVFNERIRSVNQSVRAAEAELEANKIRLERGRRAAEFVQMLGEVQSVFHRQALPQAVAQQNLIDMEADINGVLDLFGSPFWVETTDDLSFMVHFPGEPPRAAGRLSGGQRGVLAVAFRTAISSLFSSDLGVMCLDEPTAGMDNDNIGYLAEALSRFAAQIRGRRQIVVITHAEGLRPAFDQLIEVGVTSDSNNDVPETSSVA